MHKATKILSNFLCKCGCGKFTYLVKESSGYRNLKSGEPRRFLSGHNIKGTILSVERKEQIGNQHRGIRQSEETIGKRRLSNAGYRCSEETKRKIGSKNKGKIPWHAGKTGCFSPESVQKISDAVKRSWQDQVIVKKRKDGMRITPNKSELKLFELLGILYPDQWKYTGDFSLTINGKCPDFVNCNGQKKIIELFGDYWHQGDDPADRAAAFSPLGYKTLVIWESEMKDMQKVENRIREFCKEAV